MAKAADKKRLEENAAHLRLLQILIAGANVAFVLVRLVLRRATAGKLLYFGFALTTVLYLACYRFISGALSPAYSSTGEVVFAGQDRSIGGALSYFEDVVYISLFVQLLGCWTDRAWLAFLAVPAYAVYALVIHVGLPWWNTPKLDDMQESEADRKRREKKERQAARSAKFAARQ